MDDRAALLRRTAELAGGFLERLPDRPVSRAVNLDELRAALGGPLPVSGEAILRCSREVGATRFSGSG
jgi:hypothetical protein